MARPVVKSVAALLAVSWISGCQGASSSSGLTAMLRVEGAQVRPGHITDAPEDQAAATVSGLTSGSNLIYPAIQGRGVSGKVGPGATAVAIGLAKDNAFWILPAGSHDTTSPDLLNFSAQLDFSPDLAGSSVVEQDSKGNPVVPITFRAVTQDGRLGPSLILGMTVLSNEPSGSLVISLRWDAPVDFDLRVLAPLPDGTSTVEIWSKHASNVPLDTNSALPADQQGAVGSLDFDSNAGCNIDGRDQENVVWQGLPPAGHYVVRVDAFSLCGQVSAEWEAQATYNGQPLTKTDGNPADVFGIATDAATRGDHGAGAGVRAFEFDLQFQQQ
jgi:hypothetical protein